MMRVAAIIYGDESGIVRRVVVSDSLKELAAPTVLGKGENCIIRGPDEVLKGGLPDLATCYALVEDKRGKPSEPNRVVIIDDKTGEIEGVTLADPLIDVLPEKTLFQDDKADIGWTLDEKGEFVPPVVEAGVAAKDSG